MKKQTLKARGIRFSNDQWDNLKRDAKKEKATVSDIVRGIVDAFYAKKK